MKIVLKLTYEITELICDLYDQDLDEKKRNIYQLNTSYKEFKAVSNLMESFINKMKKKLIDKQGEKDFKMSFKYYEAYFLAVFINKSLLRFTPTDYNRVILFNLFLKIDKKL